jgi:uncharacterized protein (UPF0333 family)
MKKHTRLLTSQKGQTTLEYILLLAATFVTSYFVVTGPMANFTRNMLQTIRSALVNVVQNGELTPGEVLSAGQAGHPGDVARAKPLH